MNEAKKLRLELAKKAHKRESHRILMARIKGTKAQKKLYKKELARPIITLAFFW